MLGFGLSKIFFGMATKTALAVGASLAPTSMGISLKVLQDAQVLSTPTGQLIIAAAVIDDVIALVLLVGRPWPVIKAATAFTLAHSLTLAAVTLGFAGIRQDVVEALIALSIVFLAVEIARGARGTLTQRLPWLVAFAFGLLHGFGFAGALREIGLPEGEVPAALVSFNIGVEAGQLLVVTAVLAALALLRRIRPADEPLVLRAAAYPVGIVGAYWLIERIAA